MDQSDVATSSSSSSSGKSGQFARAWKVTSFEMTMVHRPSGITVTGKVPTGHYSKREMQKLRRELESSLWTELERRVGRANTCTSRKSK